MNVTLAVSSARRADIDAPRKAFRMVEARGIVLARFQGMELVEEEDVRQVDSELRALIASGRSRIVLGLGWVEGISGMAVRVMAEARDHCRASGGLLKLCELSPQAFEVFAFLGEEDGFEIAPDARTAVEGAWTGGSRPVSLLETVDAPTRPASATVRVRLVILAGKARGQAVEVGASAFAIGRDPSCHLRPNSPAVSRRHSAIEQRDGRVFVRDLGAKNGTMLNDSMLRGEEAEVSHGDRLRIGPLLFAIALGDRELNIESSGPGDSAGSWPVGEERARSGSTLLMTPEAAPVEPRPASPQPTPSPFKWAPSSHPSSSLSHRVVGDALLITILPADVNDEVEVGPIRFELVALFEQPEMPRRVIVNLDRVSYLSSRGVGVILAHFQRLTRSGGTLRLCQTRPNVARVLEQMRVPMLIDVFPTVEEALERPWDESSPPDPSR